MIHKYVNTLMINGSSYGTKMPLVVELYAKLFIYIYILHKYVRLDEGYFRVVVPIVRLNEYSILRIVFIS